MAQKKLRQFDSVSAAFDYCRTVNRPVRVQVQGQPCKVYPSGLLERPLARVAKVLDFKARASGEREDEIA